MKNYVLVFAAAMLLNVANIFAQDCDYSGTTGPLNWCLKDGTLTISGEGEMPDYFVYTDDYAPWFEYRTSIHIGIIEAGVTNIGNHAFFECTSMVSITIPSSITTIGESFVYCISLTSITIPDGVKSIGGGAFYYCYSLTSITISNSVTSIGYGAFYFCLGLTSITLPNSITNIVDWAFYNCENLSSITNLNPVPITINPNVFSLVKISTCTLKVPIASVSDYKNAEVWKEFNIIGIMEGVYSVIVNVNNEEYGTATGGGLYEENTTATITATANNGYKFVNWTIDDEVVYADNPYSFTVTEDVALVANFVDEDVETYLVSVSVNNEEYGTTTGGGLYEENTTATITATANNGYKFVNWTIDDEVVSSDNPYSFTVTEDVELVANFVEEVGIEQLTMENGELTIYPNPTTGELHVTGGANHYSPLRIRNIEIFDVMGRKVSSFEFRVSSSGTLNLKPEIFKPETAIDISHLPSGIYFLRIQTENGVVVRKVVKQ